MGEAVTPKNWLVEYKESKYVMSGYGDALQAVRAWADDFALHGEIVRVSQIVDSVQVIVNMSVTVDYR